jgi:hypothetical protein
MPLTDTDYLNWYNDEITRYRNLEWTISGYSIGISYATILFASDPNTKFVVSTNALAIVLFFFVVCLLFAEWHIHDRLNKYRAKRDSLIQGGDHLNKEGTLWRKQGWRDHAFFLSFILFPAVVGSFAIWTLVAALTSKCR